MEDETEKFYFLSFGLRLDPNVAKPVKHMSRCIETTFKLTSLPHLKNPFLFNKKELLNDSLELSYA